MAAAGLGAARTVSSMAKPPPPALVAHLLAGEEIVELDRPVVLVHRPPGERKSGMPHSVEMPAPVKGTMMEAAGDHLAELFDAALKIRCNHLCAIRWWSNSNIRMPSQQALQMWNQRTTSKILILVELWI